MTAESRTDTADGTVEHRGDAYVLRYERRLRHPMERVWSALTEPAQIVAWLGEADLELVEGGRVEIRWLNTDEQGNSAVARGSIARLDPPRVLEIETDIHGVLLWELRPHDDGTALTFTVTAALPDEMVTRVAAGWHVHLDFLEDALDGHAVDWANWPFDRWAAHHERYVANLARPGAA
jgi:uncharacterized protein YndB with AHSA1/START domain